MVRGRRSGRASSEFSPADGRCRTSRGPRTADRGPRTAGSACAAARARTTRTSGGMAAANGPATARSPVAVSRAPLRVRLRPCGGWRLGDGRFRCAGLRRSHLGDGRHDLRPDPDPADGQVHRLLTVRHRQGRHLGRPRPGRTRWSFNRRSSASCTTRPRHARSTPRSPGTPDDRREAGPDQSHARGSVQRSKRRVQRLTPLLPEANGGHGIRCIFRWRMFWTRSLTPRDLRILELVEGTRPSHCPAPSLASMKGRKS
jgi:hypothetical protein